MHTHKHAQMRATHKHTHAHTAEPAVFISYVTLDNVQQKDTHTHTYT